MSTPTLSARLASAPHRLAFLAGSLQIVLAMLWWLAVLVARHLGIAIEPALGAGTAHAMLMLYGTLPFFIFGFLFTALPNWLETGPVARPRYLATLAPMALGALPLYPGLYLPGLALIALLGLATGWAIGLAGLADRLRASRLADTLHARLALLAMTLGWLGLLALLAGLAGGQQTLVSLAADLGIWGFLTPLFLVVCHRMIPFFTARVVANYVTIRPNWTLKVMVAACLAHGALAATGLPQWTWLVDLPLAGLTVWLSTRWGIARSFGVRLLAMLHIGFVWAGLAFVLFAFDSLLWWFDADLGLAPLHVLAIGCFGSLLVGMASRVSLGHSGRKLEADNFTWALFWLVQVASLVRMLPELIDAPYGLVAVSAGLWLLAFVPWAARYAPYYWRPRADGRPG